MVSPFKNHKLIRRKVFSSQNAKSKNIDFWSQKYASRNRSKLCSYLRMRNIPPRKKSIVPRQLVAIFLGAL